MQIFISCKATLHVSGVTAPIIRSTKNCNRSLRYRSYYLYRYSPPTWSDRDGETCRVALQEINICILLHMVGFLFTLKVRTVYKQIHKATSFTRHTNTGVKFCYGALIAYIHRVNKALTEQTSVEWVQTDTSRRAASKSDACIWQTYCSNWYISRLWKWLLHAGDLRSETSIPARVQPICFSPSARRELFLRSKSADVCSWTFTSNYSRC